MSIQHYLECDGPYCSTRIDIAAGVDPSSMIPNTWTIVQLPQKEGQTEADELYFCEVYHAAGVLYDIGQKERDTKVAAEKAEIDEQIAEEEARIAALPQVQGETDVFYHEDCHSIHSISVPCTISKVAMEEHSS